MSSNILITKSYIPGPREHHIPRPALLEKLQGVWSHSLTLISAPAGFGKSTLVGEWARQQEHAVFWLSLDADDNDLGRFLRYVRHALQPLAETTGALPAELPASEDPLTRLLNQLAALSQPFALILDDYHVITEPEIQEAMRYLVEHLPPQMHVLISSRADPPWPLGRQRARGLLLEVRADELRFTRQQSGELLEKTAGRKLADEDIAALDRRTEGWAAGLHLAGLSLRSQQDVAAFVRSFTGSHRFLMDYLLEEILDQQPPDRRTFLLHTAILNRLSASQCDAVTQRQDSQQVLADLEASNLFLQPLDDRRRWYRYHHLFGDLLHSQLRQEISAEAYAALHRRAAHWYEETGLLSDAIRHAVAAEDVGMVVRMTENLALFAMDHEEFSGLVGWLDRLPEAVYQQYPWLYVTRALAFSKVGYERAIEEEAARVHAALSRPGMDPETARRVRGQLAAVESYLAELRDDAPVAIRKAEEALDLIPAGQVPLRCYVSIRLANCLVWSGALEEAIATYRKAGALARRAGDHQSVIVALSEANVVQMFSGSVLQALAQSEELCGYAEQLAARDGRQLPGMGVLYRHMSHIQRERNELEDAVRLAQDALRISQRWGEREAIFFATLALARAHFAQGRVGDADALLDRAGWIADQMTPKVMEFARLWRMYHQLLQGRTEEASAWVYGAGVSSPGDFSYALRFKYEVYARYLFMSGDLKGALRVVETLARVLKQAGDRYTYIRAGVFQSLVLQSLGRNQDARARFVTALAAARAGGYIRAVLDEGAGVVDLLHMAVAAGRESEYAGLLLEKHASAPWPLALDAAAGEGLLSEREMEVLRLLQTSLTVPEIAEQLFVAPSTVRSHVKNIYAQLDVHSRSEAVAKAKELRLV